jgi:hypothetical protein
MVKLNGTDAAILARVAKYSSVAPVRRHRMLEKASPQARVIGNIVITHNENGAAPDVVRAARNIMEWAAEERLDRTVAYTAYRLD